MRKCPLLEASKEAFRILLISIIPVLLGSINTVTGEITINWQIVVSTGLVALLRFADKYAHENNKADYPGHSGESMGILPF